MALIIAASAALLVQLFVAHGAPVGLAAVAVASACCLCVRALAHGENTRSALAVSLSSALCFGCAAAWKPIPSEAGHVLGLLGAGARSATSLSLSADVVEPPRLRRFGASAVVEVRGVRRIDGSIEPAHGRVSLFVRHASGRLRFGDRIAFRARLIRIANFGNPGELDYAAWCARRGIYVSAFVWDDHDVVSTGTSPDLEAVTRMRVRIAQAAIGNRGGAGAMTAALVVGDGSEIGAGEMEAIRISGLSHLLAISGMNVGVVAWVALWVCRWVVMRTRIPAVGRDPLRPAALAAVAAVLAYAALSGGGESVVRATIMSLCVLAAMWQGRRASGPGAIAIAALALCVISPGAAAEAGFQLSFAATGAILAYAAPLRDVRLPTGARALVVAAAIGLVCWAVTAPILAYHFERISLVAPLSGLATGIPSALVVVAGLAGAALLPLSERASGWAFDAASWGGWAILAAARAASRPAWAEQMVLNPGGPIAAALALLPVVPAIAPPARRRVLTAILVVIAVCGAARAHARFRSDRMDVVFASVGQGDATIVRLPGSEVLLVDGGPPGRGHSVVAPLLRRMSVRRIDYMVVTHVQDDHWGGLAEIAEELEVGELWYPGGACEHARFAELVERLRARGVRVVDVGATLAARDTVSTERDGIGAAAAAHAFAAGRVGSVVLRRRGAGGWRLRALWPAEAQGRCDANDRSVVLRLAFGRSRVLLAGDVESAAELAIARIPRVRASVLKAPHHGSRTSSSPALLAAVRPAAAVASCGSSNRYGFPHSEVLGRYAAWRVPFYRTDLDGAVRLTAYRDRIVIHAVKSGASQTIFAPSRRGAALRQRVD